MNNKKLKSAILSISLCSLLVACGSDSNKFDDPVEDQSFNSGDVDLSRYVALGDSLTAGYKDGALYLDGQLDSFPNILSGLFSEADGGSFTQPLVADNLGGLLFPNDPRLLLSDPFSSFDTRFVLASVNGDLATVRQNGIPTTEVFDVQAGPFNNVGVPGAKSFHLLADGYGSFAGLQAVPAQANPFYVRFASSQSSSIISDAATQLPTFFSLWIGNNDILGYATTGGDGSDFITPATGTPVDGNTCSTDFNFQDCYSTIVGVLTQGGAKGVLINIPSVVDIPYFTAVPFNSIPLDAATAAGTNASYDATYNAGLTAAVSLSLITLEEADNRRINFIEGQNAVVILDEALTDLSGVPGLNLPSLRQATAQDFILLTSSSLLGTLRDVNDLTTVIGVGSPLLDAEVLTAAEAAEVEVARSAYNSVIEGLAASSTDLAMFDAASLLADLNDGDGISFGTGNVDGTFATGGAFSLDGVHPTARGYAIIANGIIDTMNAEFNASLPKTDPGEFSETFFEFPDGFDFSP